MARFMAWLKRLLHYAFLAFVVLAAGVASGVIVMQIALRGGKDVVIPSVEGNEVVAALEKMTQAGLNLKITSLEYDAAHPRNTIISQQPRAGAAVKAGRDVLVVISRGPREFDMPVLAGLTERQAAGLMMEKGLGSGMFSRIHAAAPEGKVVAQLPAAGAHVSDLRQVELLISAGAPAELALAPNLLGLTADAAGREILRAGFAPGATSYEENKDAVSGAVSAQNPPGGMPVEIGSAVSITVIKHPSEPGKPATYTLYTITLPAGAPQGTLKMVQETRAGQKEIYNRVHKGGDTVSAVVETGGPSTLRVFLNDTPLEVKQFAQ